MDIITAGSQDAPRQVTLEIRMIVIILIMKRLIFIIIIKRILNYLPKWVLNVFVLRLPGQEFPSWG